MKKGIRIRQQRG